MKLHNYTLKYFTMAILGIIAVWAVLFYAFILDEVYDNIDDGLKNSKIEIIKEAYKNPDILKTNKFGINNFRITQMPKGEYPSKSILKTTTDYLAYDDEDEPIRLLITYFYDKDSNPYKLEIKTSMIEEDDLLTDLSVALIVLYIMLVISTFTLNFFILKKVWNPFYSLLQRLQSYTPGINNKLDSPQQKIQEFNDLQSGIEKMIVRNENAFEQQKLFISNAAHELQTPLAISLNKLELLAETPEITAKQLEIVSSINDSLERLVRLNKSLLLLTKIENNQFSEKESVDFNNLIKTCVEEFSDLAEHKNIIINILESGNFIFIMDKGLAIILINNLLKNSIIHNYQSGNINFIISNKSIIIQNTSNQSSLDSKLIFNRFYRHTTHSKSIGLGLALVKTIIDTNPELSINYYFDGMQNFKILKNNF